MNRFNRLGAAGGGIESKYISAVKVLFKVILVGFPVDCILLQASAVFQKSIVCSGNGSLAIPTSFLFTPFTA